MDVFRLTAYSVSLFVYLVERLVRLSSGVSLFSLKTPAMPGAAALSIRLLANPKRHAAMIGTSKPVAMCPISDAGNPFFPKIQPTSTSPRNLEC